VLYLADHYAPRRRTIEQLTMRDGILIGFAQALALIPGVSRSGATMSAACSWASTAPPPRATPSCCPCPPWSSPGSSSSGHRRGGKRARGAHGHRDGAGLRLGLRVDRLPPEVPRHAHVRRVRDLPHRARRARPGARGSGAIA
jgi:hypothetical protein